MARTPHIEIAQTAGFCSGVNRAIKQARDLLGQGKCIFCLGDIIHNPRVVASLRDAGLQVVESLDDIPAVERAGHEGKAPFLLVRTHGLPVDMLNAAREKNLEIVDLTCPRVTRIHQLVEELGDGGYYLYIVGDPDHPEVRAITSRAGMEHRVIETVEQVAEHEGSGRDRCAVVVQTTFNPTTFHNIVREIVTWNSRTLVCNTLCGETIRRQREASRLAGKVDLMLIVGGKNSSNTKTLYTLVHDRVPALHIEGAHELERSSIPEGVKKIGVISGASTPREEVELVRDTIASLFGKETG
jgi:4-hydroxy-3-methylbut-2-enyl diphosphate reductase